MFFVEVLCVEKSLKGLFDKLNNIEINFSYGKRSPLSGRKLYVFAFFIPVLVLFVSYMILGVYPAGEKSVLVSDMADQYINYYENFRDAFWGNGSLVNSWSRNLSGETMGLFAYYLASPFIIVVLLLPRSIITESVLIMQLLKSGTASVSFCWYLRHSKKTYDNTSLIFSILYSLMTYMVVQLMNIMWLEGLIYLPLICYGIEKLTDTGRCLPFIIPLTLMFAANFYIGWMLAIFSCFYFVIYYFFLSDVCRQLKIYNVFPKGIKFALSGILAAVCAAGILLPLYYSLTLGKLGFDTPDYSIITQFDFIDVFVNMLPNTYDTVMHGGSPLLYCGVLTLVLIPFYFFNGSIELRKKTGYGILAAFIAVSMYSYGMDVIWHGLQPPQGFPYRYSFIFSFVLLVMAAEVFDKIDKISYTKIGCVFFVLLGYIFYVDKQNNIISASGKAIEKTRLIETIWFAAIMTAVYILLIYLHKKYYKVKPIPFVVTFFVIAELIFTSAYTMYKVDVDLNYIDRSEYAEFTKLGREIVNDVYGMDDGTYRMEKNFSNLNNEALGLGYFGVAHSSSVINIDAIRFLRNMGFAYDGHIIKYKGATYVTDAVLGIKYIMDAETAPEPEPEEDKFQEYFNKYINVMLGFYFEREEARHYDNVVLSSSMGEETINVYENPNALPIGFMADSSIADLKLSSWENPFENQNMLLSHLLSDEEQDFFVRLDIDDDVIMKGVERDIYDAHDWYKSTVGGGGSVDFTFTAPGSEMIYMFLPSDYERPIRLSVNDELLGRYFLEEYLVLLTLGRFEPGEKVKVTASLTEGYGEVMFKDKYFYYLDEEKFAEAVDKLKQHPLEIESFSEDHLKGTVIAEDDGILFTSITYEPGWTVYVDGEKTEPVKLVDALIGVPMKAGIHSVEMKFFPKGLTEGILISIAGIAAVVLIGLYEHKKYAVRKDT